MKFIPNHYLILSVEVAISSLTRLYFFLKGVALHHFCTCITCITKPNYIIHLFHSLNIVSFRGLQICRKYIWTITIDYLLAVMRTTKHSIYIYIYLWNLFIIVLICLAFCRRKRREILSTGLSLV